MVVFKVQTVNAVKVFILFFFWGGGEGGAIMLYETLT